MQANDQAGSVINDHDPARVAQGDAMTSDIAIVDRRKCISDAMANALRGITDRRVFTANSASALSKTPFCTDPSQNQLILFCDGSLDDNSIRESIGELKKLCPKAALTILTDKSDHHHLYQLSTELGINGIIPSHYDTRQLLACIRLIESGIEYFPANSNCECNDCNGASAKRADNTNELLTPRQSQVMNYILQGKANKFIASELLISESTIKVHVHEAMKRLGATSRTHAVYLMSQLNLNDNNVNKPV